MLGDILLACDEESIIGLWISGQNDDIQDMIEDSGHPILKECVKWLDGYFAGNKPSIDGLPLNPQGNEFRRLVWSLLAKIPYGSLVTYSDVAKEVARKTGKEKMSTQAVGGAVGHNPISIIIPCHRVVGKGGNLTGYAGGLDKKIKLLSHEGVDMSKLHLPK